MTQLFVWGSSHCTNYRNFPNEFEAQLIHQRRYLRPIIHAKGGQKLDSQITSKIINTIQANQNKPSVHLIILGDNNLRADQTIKQVLQQFELIIHEINQNRNSYLIISGLIYGQHPDFPLFINCDLQLKLLARKQTNKQVIFVQVQKYLIGPQIYLDNVHLTRKGVQIFIKPLIKALKCVPNPIQPPTSLQ